MYRDCLAHEQLPDLEGGIWASLLDNTNEIISHDEAMHAHEVVAIVTGIDARVLHLD